MLDWIRELTGAAEAVRGERLQSLWSGYGSISRVRLTGTGFPSVVVKEVRPPAATGLSHRRKLRSYEVERAWYTGLAARCDSRCRVPASRLRCVWRCASGETAVCAAAMKAVCAS